METLQNKSKIQYYYSRWYNSSACTLNDVYGRYSNNKVNAYNYCVKLMQENNGHNLKIISHNSQFFSVAFLSRDDKTLYVITPSHNYAMEL